MKELEPVSISRISTRFINEIFIPSRFGNLEAFLTNSPKIPHDPSQEASSFFTQTVSKDLEIDATAIVTQAFDTSVSDKAHVILDIDVFVEKDFAPDNSHTWNCLADLRNFKNRIFISSITEKTARLFE